MDVIVVCEYADGRRKAVDERFDSLQESVAFALDLADQFGTEPAGGIEIPDLVRVLDGDRAELTVKVFRGGLAPSRTH